MVANHIDYQLQVDLALCLIHRASLSYLNVLVIMICQDLLSGWPSTRVRGARLIGAMP